MGVSPCVPPPPCKSRDICPRPILRINRSMLVDESICKDKIHSADASRQECTAWKFVRVWSTIHNDNDNDGTNPIRSSLARPSTTSIPLACHWLRGSTNGKQVNESSSKTSLAFPSSRRKVVYQIRSIRATIMSILFRRIQPNFVGSILRNHADVSPRALRWFSRASPSSF